MALPGETIASGASPTCPDCGRDALATLGVRAGGPGWYIGTSCDCGPIYSRESGYYPTAEEARAALETGSYGR